MTKYVNFYFISSKKGLFMREFGYIVNIGLLRGDFMNFNSYIVSETKTAFSVPLSFTEFFNKKEKLSKKIRRNAFTLAETLITLSIIGVVAAITVPTLMTNMNKQTYVTGLKKAYSQLQNAMKMLPLENGCSTGDLHCVFSGGDFNANFIRLVSEQFKTTKIFINEENNYCTDNAKNCFVTEDGMIYTMGGFHDSTMRVDVNGIKGPNKYGRDIFGFRFTSYDISNQIYYGLLLPVGSKQHGEFEWGYTENRCDINSDNEVDQLACTDKVLKEGKMNY